MRLLFIHWSTPVHSLHGCQACVSTMRRFSFSFDTRPGNQGTPSGATPNLPKKKAPPSTAMSPLSLDKKEVQEKPESPPKLEHGASVEADGTATSP